MKKILPWLKSNLISVIALALAVISAPVALFFSAKWGASVKSGVQADVQQMMQQIDQLDVTYQIEPYLAGQQPISVKSPPNEATTKAVSTLLAGVVSGAEQVRSRAVEFNSAGKVLLISGETPETSLFPNNADDSRRLTLLDAFIKRYAPAHEELLKTHRAGTVPSAEAVRAALIDLQTKEIARRTTGKTEADLTPSDREQLVELLSNTRLEIYRREATNVSFYATPAVFKGVTPWDATKVMPMETAWAWQVQYWVHEDVIRAAAAANSDEFGSWKPVFAGPVKMIESITVSETARPAAPAGRGAPGAAGAAPSGGGSGDGSAEVQRNYTVAHTGRAAAPTAPNPLYDIRYADVTMIVSASRLPQVLAAFSKVNMMTVIDVDIEEFDPLPLLAVGYDMGSEHVVRATLKIETVWLRSWMKKWMPSEVRKALGIPDDPKPDAAAGSPAPAGGSESEPPPAEE